MYPEFLKIGNFVIYWYGVMVAMGVFVAIMLFQRQMRLAGYEERLISQTIFVAVLGGIVGGRFLHILVHNHYYFRHPLETLRIRNGGLAGQGAVIFGFLSLVWYFRAKKIRGLPIFDQMVLFVPIGEAIGRIGCFLNGCCYGKIARLPWAVKFPFLAEKVHPTQIYYSLSDLLIFVILYTFFKSKHRDGEILGWYFLLNGIQRYLIDNLRGDLLKGRFDFTATQLISVAIVILSAIYLTALIFKKPLTPSDSPARPQA